jgi:hypothetical protein
MKYIKTFCTLTLTALTLFVFSSCSKNDAASSDKARLQVFLTDDPANYDQVNIDIKDVMINYSSDTGSNWVSLNGVKAGSYDLLRLRDGRDTLLGDAQIQTGKIQQIRLILGSNNTVKVGNQTYDLTTPSAQQSGLKIKINQDVNAGVLYKLLLDFDASRSIVRTGNGKYILKPVIRATVEAMGGSLKGYVLPNTFNSSVYAIQGTDTVAGTITSGGSYNIRGIAAGSYNLSFVPSDTTYKSQTKSGITITNGAVTTVDTVRLVK